MRTLALVVALLGLLVPGSASAADDDAGVAHMEPGDGVVNLLVSVPPSAAVDLDEAAVTVDGVPAEATAEPAGSNDVIRRTAVLVLDASSSMRGGRFSAAKRAALTFLEQVPDDVYVGVVTFAGEVVRAVEPGRDRDAARAAVRSVELSQATRLHDAVIDAAAMAGDDGQRSLLVLSDGADTSRTPLRDAVAAVTESEARVDAVALDLGDDELEGLAALAEAGDGELLPSGRRALGRIFAAEAQMLATQVLVTAQLPASVSAARAAVEVRLGSGAGALTASAYGPVRSSGPETSVAPTGERGGLALPSWVLLVGVGALGLGALGLVAALVAPRRSQQPTIEERVGSYRAAGPVAPRPDSSSPLAHAREAASEVLRRNRSLEERLRADLGAAGSQLKPGEWLLVWVGVMLGSGLVGLLLGRGSLVVGVLFLAIGAAAPGLYLRFRRARRRKAFDGALPDTLQLISGSLQAGLSLAQSVDTIVHEGREPVSSEFRRVLVETRLGVALEDALDHLAERFDSTDFAWVVMAIRIQREVGGNLAELLDTVGNTMREREFVRRQVSALSAEGRISAWVLGVLPPGFLLYLLVAQRDYVMPMFTDLRGLLMLGAAAFWLGVGVFWMSKLVKVEV